ncbi:MAG: hypothetical protein FWC60_04560 [Firmicutes bacterium]|nr:hypothetical protein [Bacillota bacterium]
MFRIDRKKISYPISYPLLAILIGLFSMIIVTIISCSNISDQSLPKPINSSEDSSPAKLNPKEVSRIEFIVADHSYIPLFSDKKKDKEIINQFIALYNEAVPKFAKEDFHSDTLRMNFTGTICLKLVNGQNIYFCADDGGYVYQDDVTQGYYLKDQELWKKIDDLMVKSLIPANGVTIKPESVIQLGERLYISIDYMPGNDANIEIYPSYINNMNPAVYSEKIKMDSIKIKTVPLVDGSMDYNFILTEQIGTTANGLPGKIYPGKWTLVVSEQYFKNLTIVK